MEKTMQIIVAIVVILVAALVILAIFGGFLPTVVGRTTQKNICITEYTSICMSTGNEPVGWGTIEHSVRDGDIVTKKTCSILASECDCNLNPNGVGWTATCTTQAQ